MVDRLAEVAELENEKIHSVVDGMPRMEVEEEVLALRLGVVVEELAQM
jgi:hypothetical protein